MLSSAAVASHHVEAAKKVRQDETQDQKDKRYNGSDEDTADPIPKRRRVDDGACDVSGGEKLHKMTQKSRSLNEWRAPCRRRGMPQGHNAKVCVCACVCSIVLSRG